MKKNRLITGTVNALDLPADLASEEPNIMILGCSSVSVERHTGVISCSEKEIVISCGDKRLDIKGNGLYIAYIDGFTINAVGKVKSVKYDERTKY